MVGEISLNNIIRVTVSGVQRSRGVKNVNEVALFTNEIPNSSEPYIIGYSPSAFEDAYGTNSLTMKMINNIFAQDVNINSGRGYLAVIPFSGVSATASTFTSGTVNVESFKSVSTGALVATIDGVAYSVSNLNFTGVATIGDIAKVLQNALPYAKITANTDTISFSSKKVGVDSSIVLSSSTTGVDLSGQEYLNVSEGSSSAGENAAGEKLEDAIARAKKDVRFTGVLDALAMDDAAITSCSAYINSGDYMWVHGVADASAVEGIVTSVKNAGQKKTRLLLKTDGVEEAILYAAAYVGRAFSVNFSGSATSQTMHLKTLTNVNPDGGMTDTLYLKCKNAGCDVYTSFEGSVANASFGANGYFDSVYENLALKYYIESGMFNVLYTTGTKVPQTEAGMASLRDAVAQVFELFVRNGVIAAGQWNSTQTFGDPETFKRNIQNQGWYVYSTPISEQLQSEREQRIAPVVQGACKKSGAIHEADVIIIVEE